jgi:hypothetical protein
MVVVAGRDLIIPRSETEAFIAGIGASAVVRDPDASHNSVLESRVVISAVADSMRSWAGCSVRSRSG